MISPIEDARLIKGRGRGEGAKFVGAESRPFNWMLFPCPHAIYPTPGKPSEYNSESKMLKTDSGPTSVPKKVHLIIKMKTFLSVNHSKGPIPEKQHMYLATSPTMPKSIAKKIYAKRSTR